MLYVFHVDAGQMTTYDMGLTLQNVSSLKLAIERKTKVPANSLVLLVSGGEVLQSDHMVSSYSAGTDTNPIYMFSKPSVKESHLNQSMCDLSPIVELSTGEFSIESRSAFDGKSVAELKAAVEKCCSLQPNVYTVISCASLAQQFSDLALEVSSSCDQLVHEQHLQHQGWAAVVANLEDIFNEFCERSRNFKESFRKHRLKKEEYHEKLTGLNEVLESLGKIPILPALQLNAEAHRFSAFDVFEDTEFEGPHYRITHPLDNSSENKPSDFGVEAFKLSDEDVFDQRQSGSGNEAASSSEPVPLVEESDEGVTFKAQSYENKEEPSLLHWILAQGNKASLQDILDYCQKGLALVSILDADPLKEREAELYHILEYANMHGLKHIKGIEERLYGLDQLLNDVKKLERDQRDQAASLIQCRERLNTACDPSVLPTLVQSHWCQLKKLLKGHQMLIDIRRRIAKSKDELSHILKARLEAVLMIENSMSVQDAHAMLSFQCFNRLARYFGIVAQLHRAPNVFVRAVREVARRRTFSQAHLKWAADLAEKLLKIHEEEISRRQEFNTVFEGHFLRSLFPGMSELPPTFATQAPPIFDANLPKLTEADVDYITHQFPDLCEDVPNYDMDSTVQFFQQRIRASEYERKDIDTQVDMEKDFDSVTEAGDFEKLGGQSSQKQRVDTSTICVPETMAVSTVTEDNMDTHRINMDKLQDFLVKVYAVCKVNIVFIVEELTKLKEEVNEQKKFMASKYVEILEAWEKSNVETAIRFREETQRLTVDHELELSDMKAALNAKDEVISSLKTDTENIKNLHQKELERLEQEHQETKNLLEKTRQEIQAFEKKLEEIEAQKQKEIKELQEKMHMDYKAEIESLRSRFRLVALTNMDRSPSESSLEKIERTDVIEISSHNAIVMQTKENAEVEKEEAIREAVAKVEAEWRSKMETEVAYITAKYDSEKQMASLENENEVLKQQVKDLKKELEKKAEEEKSKDEDSEGRSSSPKREEVSRRRSRSHTPCGLAAGTLSLSACLPGHTVLVLWDPAHLNYTVLQEAAIMYFVHSDCLPALDLSINVKNESDRRLYAVATVESKEYCYAKKSGNRYGMPRGSRFYRVRVRPPRAGAALPPCCDPKHRPDAMRGGVLPVLGDARPLKKWLTYMHAPDTQKSVDTSQSTSSATEEMARAPEVVTGTLINLESPVSCSDPVSAASAQTHSEDQLDSIEASEQWQNTRMHLSTISAATDMECSVGRCVGSEPLELTVSAVAVLARGDGAPSDLAEEAEP
ncbi:RB1-inducible coiled-coil protein 1-like isoform X5 [Spodoptera frugiperda]|uniref:RB1-inducible coiled-coil protein 1 n=1 Tax=Spodoptera frugiperda TaxID=7108 RepID=A0A9R0DLN4_SPOFR|nr:RB1-inducible coiled-coil protein 1-like isoform X5 [Spodoptera frugiperda]